MATNGHFAPIGSDSSDKTTYEHGVQVIDENKEFKYVSLSLFMYKRVLVQCGLMRRGTTFVLGVAMEINNYGYSTNLTKYLSYENVAPAGFNYHLISVFGSQSTGKSTLLNNLFGTHFSVMAETERRQTTKGIWLSKNKKGSDKSMADNILVMDVEGTDGRERGEDQDFERKSALFALATSEVLIVNIWEHQVGLYQGANMGLLKTVFEVNLQLFLKDKKYVTWRSISSLAQGANSPVVPPIALFCSS